MSDDGTQVWAPMEVVEALLARAEKAETAIERVRELCAEARVSVSRGCTCYGDECSGNCGRGEPFSWTLDPQAVLRALKGDSDE